jgi:hypothetical protein
MWCLPLIGRNSNSRNRAPLFGGPGLEADADPREHRRPAEVRDQEQRFRRSLPFRGLVLSLGQSGDVFCRIAERDDLATARQGY